MIRVIEHFAQADIQKVTNGDKVIGYQVVPNGTIGDTGKITRRSTLAECREIAQAFYAKPIDQAIVA